MDGLVVEEIVGLRYVSGEAGSAQASELLLLGPQNPSAVDLRVDLLH